MTTRGPVKYREWQITGVKESILGSTYIYDPKNAALILGVELIEVFGKNGGRFWVEDAHYYRRGCSAGGNASVDEGV